MADYMDCVAFLGKEGKKFPRKIGRAQVRDGGKVSVWLDLVPTGGWDGSFTIEHPMASEDRPAKTAQRRPDF